MRKAIILFLIILCSGIVFATPEITLSAITVSNPIISTGGSGGISFSITNTGDRFLTTVKIIITSELNIGTQQFIFDNLNIGESRFVTTSYSAPATLNSGSYDLSISADFDIGDTQYSNQAGAVVTVLDTNYLIVSSYTSNLIIDQYTTFNFNVTNQGNSEMSNLLLDLVLPDGFIPSPGSQFYIPSLQVGQSRVLTAQIFVEREIEPGPYQFTLSKSADGYSDSDTLNLAVTGVPEIAFSGVNLDPDIPVIGESQTISVQFENIGSGKAYNVVAELLLEQEVTGVTVEYLGTLDRDDLTSAIFDFITPQTKDLTGLVRVSYTDAQGNPGVISQTLEFDVIFVNGSSNTIILLIGGALIVAGYFAYKRYFMKKKR